ncbi:MAG TPA: hypothetical protein VN426_12360 [Syntrophomonadaceae bacterium]|nr:hypothetical protein [Syntrophomonadaceae bacterium]
MNQERLKILQLIEEGKVTASEGLELLQALEAPRESKPADGRERVFRVKVDGDKTKVNVNIPLRLVRVASKFATLGMNFIPEQARTELDNRGIDLSQFDFDELIDLIDQGLVDGKLVDVNVEDPNEGRITVEVYVE